MRAVASLALIAALAGCAGAQSRRGGTLSKTHYLSAIQAIPAPMHPRGSVAPVVGLMVSGTITNDGKAQLHCSASEFVLVRADGSGEVLPTTEFCGLPAIAPQQSAYFNATFNAAPADEWKLRFEHGDGTYEIHDLIVPPAG